METVKQLLDSTECGKTGLMAIRDTHGVVVRQMEDSNHRLHDDVWRRAFYGSETENGAPA